jgi:hypothetical protein
MKAATAKLMFSSASTDHRTPIKLVESITAHFGPIALDPCASLRKATVDAAIKYRSGGLERSWGSGLVYVNPPYGRGVADWVLKARREARRGAEVLLLLPARTDTRAFRLAVSTLRQPLVCFIYGRLQFYGETAPAPFPSVLLYYGKRPRCFAALALEWGSLWRRAENSR